VFRNIRFIVGFALARGSLFIAPLLLANLLSVDAYGTIELAQAVASLFAIIFGMGLQSTTPLILLRPEVTARWDTLLWLLSRIAMVACLTTVVISLIAGTFFSLPILIGLSAATLMLQGFWSSYLKSNERGTSAVFLDSSFWIAVTIGATIASLFNYGLWMITGSLAIYCCVLIYRTFRTWQHETQPFSLQELRQNISLGLPLMATTLLTIAVSSSGRLLLGLIASVETVGIYAILYRATALPLVGHQILVIGLFRRLFVWDMSVLQKRAPLIILGVASLVMFFWLAAPYYGWLLGDAFTYYFESFQFESHVILSTTILWSAVALNDLLVSRLQIAGKVSVFTATYLVIGLPLLVLVSSNNDARLSEFVTNYAVLLIGYYLVQCIGIWRQGHVFSLLWASAVGATCLACTSTFLLHSS